MKKFSKAFFSKLYPETVPFTHSLSYLTKKGEFYEMFSDSQKEFIDQIEPINMEARYPSHKEWLLQSLTDLKCPELMKQENYSYG